MIIYFLLLFPLIYFIYNKNNKIDSKIYGLQLGCLISNFLFDQEDLHYGYFKKKINNKKINLNEFKIAQQNYTDLILKNIPKNVKNILDVGSGCGTIAKKLIDKNYYVDCVSPDPFLSKRIIKNIGDDIKIYENKFEDIQINKKYDLILFSESFQYIDMKKCMIKIKNLLNDDGFVLITDCFKKDICNMRGGHNYNDFNKIIKKNNLRQIKKIDITYETSITYEFKYNFYKLFLKDFFTLIIKYINLSYPLTFLIFKFFKFNKIKKYKEKFERENSEYFRQNKEYYLLLFKYIKSN